MMVIAEWLRWRRGEEVCLEIPSATKDRTIRRHYNEAQW